LLALDVLMLPARPCTLTQGAVYETANSIDKTYEPDLQNEASVAATASMEAAVAMAAPPERRSSPCSEA
jgi:hypothetical protein